MKTLTDVRKHPSVADAFRDSDGYWIFLIDGYVNPHLECGMIHEILLKKCISQLNQIESNNPVSINKKGIDS
jgi:hypothetical protein